MPILEKAPHKMAAKTLSSEEEPVSDFWSPLSYPYSPHSHALGSQNSPEGNLPLVLAWPRVLPSPGHEAQAAALP